MQGRCHIHRSEFMDLLLRGGMTHPDNWRIPTASESWRDNYGSGTRTIDAQQQTLAMFGGALQRWGDRDEASLGGLTRLEEMFVNT